MSQLCPVQRASSESQQTCHPEEGILRRRISTAASWSPNLRRMLHYQLPIPRSPHPTQYPDLCYTKQTESIARMNTFLGILTLGFIILIHEWGHYIAARLCQVRVDVFSIGFGPRLFGMKRGAPA